MKKLTIILIAILILTCFVGCKKTTDYSGVRKLTWSEKELTISLGTNKSTGFEWTTKPQDDNIIDYSVNRVFHLDPQSGEATGTLDAGFEAKGPGTSQIICTTPCGWDGTGEGETLIVSVTVGDNGNIESATFELSDSPFRK